MGVHHAREWPSGEHAMEWAYELINGYKAGDARATNIVRNSRNIVVPIVNPDGFNGSRSAGPGRRPRRERRRHRLHRRRRPRRVPAQELPRRRHRDRARARVSVGLAENGVDPNRNYGQFWGGPGSDTQPARPRPTAARRRSPSPSRATSSGSSPATR